MLVRLPVDPRPVQLNRSVSFSRSVDHLRRVIRAVIVEHRSVDRRVVVTRVTNLRDRTRKTVVPVAKNVWPHRRLVIVVVVRRDRLRMILLYVRCLVVRVTRRLIPMVVRRVAVLEYDFRILHAHVLVRSWIRLPRGVEGKVWLIFRWTLRAVEGWIVAESLVSWQRAVCLDSVKRDEDTVDLKLCKMVYCIYIYINTNIYIYIRSKRSIIVDSDYFFWDNFVNIIQIWIQIYVRNINEEYNLLIKILSKDFKKFWDMIQFSWKFINVNLNL